MKTEIIFLADRSGSMQRIRLDAIGGFNAYINDQKKVNDDTTMSLYYFDDKYDVIFEDKKLGDVEELNENTFVPRGDTALFDAIAKTIASLNEKRTKGKASPDKTLFIILTDGEENASKEFSRYSGGAEAIKKMIEKQKIDHDWQFVFLSANQDAFASAENIGVSRGNTMSYTSNAGGTKAAFANLSKMSSRYRGATTDSIKTSAEDLFLKDEQDAERDA